MGATVAELASVLDAISRGGLPRDRIAICLDTAHLWGAGYRINEPEELDRLLDEFDAAIGLDRLAMMHLNDSRSELGSHADRHQHVGAGEIGEAGMRGILCHPRLVHVPGYLETPGMDEGYDAINMRRCRDLMAGRPLEALPPEALTMPGSRSRGGPAREPGDEEEDDRSRKARRRERKKRGGRWPGTEPATAGATGDDASELVAPRARGSRERSRRLHLRVAHGDRRPERGG